MIEPLLPNFKTPIKPVLRNVNCVYIPAKDPDLLHEWFNRVFGLNQKGWTRLANSLALIFVKSETSGQMSFEGHWDDKTDYKMYVMQFEVEDAEALHHTLKESGIQVSDLRDNGGCGLEFDFTDPEGNRYCAWEDQRMVWLLTKGTKAGSSRLDRFAFGDPATDVHAYLTRVLEEISGTPRRIQFATPSIIREKDPEGLAELLGVLEKFNQENPEKALRIMYEKEK